MNMSDLGDTLIMQDFDAKVILLKIWFFYIISWTTSKVIGVLVNSPKYKILMILRYNLD